MYKYSVDNEIDEQPSTSTNPNSIPHSKFQKTISQHIISDYSNNSVESRKIWFNHKGTSFQLMAFLLLFLPFFNQIFLVVRFIFQSITM